MLKRYVAALALGLPFAAHADQPVPMNCDLSVKAFFAPLIQRGLISRAPFMVDDHSINHFKTVAFKPLSVYGMPVAEVFGYTDEPLLFSKRGDGAAGDVYGVVVRESIANVQAQLTSMGAGLAKTYRVGPQATAIACKGI